MYGLTLGLPSRLWRIVLATSAVAVAHHYNAPWRTETPLNAALKAGMIDAPVGRAADMLDGACRVVPA